ncbi:MAG TPA: hypothetical protein VHV27_13345 [Phenylobacterium sp.]|jgi:hypothetical protein|nr:hypothetical protein [Phenylobacterium sp.]
MSTRVSGVRRTIGEHFEPDDPVDAKAQRALRGALEQIDYTAFIANKEVMGAAIGRVEAGHFQRLGLSAAQARARWAAAALEASEAARPPTREQVEELIHLREAFEELTAVYDALRRMVERGYLAYGQT